MRKRLRSQSLYHQVALLFFCFVLFMLVQALLLAQLKRSVEQTATQLTDIVQQEADRQLRSFYASLKRIEAKSHRLEQGLRREGPLSPSVVFLQEDIRDEFKQLALVERYEIDYPELGYRLGRLGLFSHEHYKRLAEHAGEPESMEGLEAPSYPEQLFFQDWKGKPGLFYQLVSSQGGKLRQQLRMNLKFEALFTLSILEQEPYELLLFFQDRLMLDRAGEAGQSLEGFDTKKLLSEVESGSVRATFDGEVILLKQSELSPFVYGLKFSTEKELRPYRWVFFLCLFAGIGSLTLGLFALGSLYVRQIKPLRFLAKKLVPGEASQATVEDLRLKIEALIQAREKAREELSEQQILLDDAFLHRLLHPQGLTDRELYCEANRYHVLLEGEYFQLLLLEVEDGLELESVLIAYELMQVHQLGGLVRLAGSLMILLNSEERLETERIEAYLRDLFQQACLGKRCKASIVPAVQALSEVQESYKGGKKALQLGTFLLGGAIYQCQEGSPLVTEASSKVDLVARARERIEADYARSDLSLYWLSEQLGVNHCYLSSSFKQVMGLGVIHYINQVRIEAAKSLLQAQQITIKEVAQQVGYSSDVNFIRCFKKFEAMTPTEWRKSLEL